MGFYGSNDPTDSVKALKEAVVLRTGFNPTRSTSPCYNITHACNNTYTKMNLSTVKWAQWDKTQSRELLGLFICVCIALCTTIAHNIAQNRPDNFPSYPPDNHHCSDDVYLREGIPQGEFTALRRPPSWWEESLLSPPQERHPALIPARTLPWPLASHCLHSGTAKYILATALCVQHDTNDTPAALLLFTLSWKNFTV